MPFISRLNAKTLLSVLLTLFGLTTAAQTPAAHPSLSTEITSDSVTYDMENGNAVFSGNVRVTDSQFDLRAAKMVLWFDENKALKAIACQGDVAVFRDGYVATGDLATYDYQTGFISLSGNPVLRQGTNQVAGSEKIIFNRAQGSFRTQGGQPTVEAYRQKVLMP
jgi:lipopolysaccharide export system protein LptA